MSNENSKSPNARRTALDTFGEGQMQIGNLRGSLEDENPLQSRRTATKARSVSPGDDPRASRNSKVFQKIDKGPEHDKIL